jgi:hypothetical protein
MAVYCGNDRRPTNTLLVNARLLTVDAGGTYSYHSVLKGYENVTVRPVNKITEVPGEIKYIMNSCTFRLTGYSKHYLRRYK